MFQSFTRKVLRVAVVLYVFARLAACEIAIDPEPIEVNATIDIVITLEMLNDCDMRTASFALWLHTAYDGEDILCAEEPEEACMLWLAPNCGVAVESTDEGYCVHPVVDGCGDIFNVIE